MIVKCSYCQKDFRVPKCRTTRSKNLCCYTTCSHKHKDKLPQDFILQNEQTVQLREKVSALNTELTEICARLEVVEGLLLDSIKKPNIQDLTSPMVKVDEDEEMEMRTLVGFKIPKR